MLKSVSTSLVPLYCAPPQKPLSNSLSLCVRLCENCHFLFQSTYFESGVWGTCRLLFCPVSPSRGQVRPQELFSGGKQNLKIFTLRHVLAGCGPYSYVFFQISNIPCTILKRRERKRLIEKKCLLNCVDLRRCMRILITKLFSHRLQTTV